MTLSFVCLDLCENGILRGNELADGLDKSQLSEYLGFQSFAHYALIFSNCELNRQTDADIWNQLKEEKLSAKRSRIPRKSACQ